MKAAGQPYSGKYGFVETSMVWPVNHMVVPKASARSATTATARRDAWTGKRWATRATRGIRKTGRKRFGTVVPRLTHRCSGPRGDPRAFYYRTFRRKQPAGTSPAIPERQRRRAEDGKQNDSGNPEKG